MRTTQPGDSVQLPADTFKIHPTSTKIPATRHTDPLNSYRDPSMTATRASLMSQRGPPGESCQDARVGFFVESFDNARRDG